MRDTVTEQDERESWSRRDQKIDLPRLLKLIEDHVTSAGLDLRGARLEFNDFSRPALEPFIQAWNQGDNPPWLYGPWGIDLKGVLLDGANLSATNLKGANLLGASLNGAILFSTILEDATLVAASLKGALLFHANLTGAGLQNANLERANLMGAKLNGAQLGGAVLTRTSLLEAQLQDIDLRRTTLERAYLHEARFGRTKVSRQNLGYSVAEELEARGRLKPKGVGFATFADAKDVYLDLKANFNSIGYYDEASWAYLKERRMEKSMYFPTTVGLQSIQLSVRKFLHRGFRKFPLKLFRQGAKRRPAVSVVPRLYMSALSMRFHLQIFFGLVPKELKEQLRRQPGQAEYLSRWHWVRNCVFDWLSGYGERPLKPVLWAVAVILAFAVGYAIAGNVASDFAGDPATAEGSHSFLDALTHSIGAFATIGFNTLEPLGWGARLLTAIESALGIGLFALFIFTLGNRMSRS